MASLVFLLTLRQPFALDAINIVGNMDQDASVLPTVGVLSVLIFIVITGGMLGFSLSMLMRNITAVEELFSGENPYRLASVHDNATQLLGPVDLRILLPLEPRRSDTGTSFPVRKQALAAQVNTGTTSGSGVDSEVRARTRGQKDNEDQLVAGVAAEGSSYGSVV